MAEYKKYIKIRDYTDDREKIDKHYSYCNKNKIPYIIVKETGEYAIIKVDYITVSLEIDKHEYMLTERFKNWLDDAIRKDFLKKGEFNTWGVCSQMTVRKQCADYYAEAAFNIYLDLQKFNEQ